MWGKRSKPTAGTVMADVVLLSDGQLTELFYRTRAHIADRASEREKELDALRSSHTERETSLKIVIGDLDKALDRKQ